MADTEKLVCCMVCDYKTEKVFNLKRHMVRNHGVKKVDVFDKKVDVFDKKVDVFDKKVDVFDKKVDVFDKKVDDNVCYKCDKQFCRKAYLKVHLETCEGEKDPLKCQYCNKEYSSRSSKSHHVKTCKAKIEQESRELIVVKETGLQPQIINNNTTNQNAETININNNNSNNQIIVFNTTDQNFINNEELVNKIRKLICTGGFDHSATFKNCTREILNEPQNLCIKKTNLKMNNSKVHIGNNEWQTKHDDDIYPPLVCKFADEMCEINGSKKFLLKKKEFDDFLQYMADYGYINTDDEEKCKGMKKKFKSLVNELCYIIFDKTKS